MATERVHGRRATMTDVAREAGVSLKTVSRVVNEVPSVDSQLAARVHSAAEALGYRPNFAAATLRSGSKTATIGLLIKDLRNEFYATIAAGVAEVARSNGYQLITSDSGENPEDEMDAVMDLCRRRVDGLLIVPTSGGNPGLRREMELGTPMVFLDRRPEDLSADVVVIDNFEGARTGVGELLGQGHRRVGVLIDTLKMTTMAERLAGARQAYADRGMTLDEGLVVRDVATPEAAARATGRLIDSAAKPTAFFCGNNRSGIGALRALWARRRTDPLVCFDDFDLSELMPRPLTIVGYDNAAIGTRGAEILLRRIRGEEFAPETVVLPTDLRRRGINHPSLHAGN